jgi:DNA-binding NtrC family response regulator
MLVYTSEGHMAHLARRIKVLAIAPAELKEKLERQISSFGMVPVVVANSSQLAPYIRTGEQYQVVLLPASLPNTEQWWTIWGEVAMLSPKPAILVYAQTATFELWSSVLEVGGYDVIVEPLTDEKLKEALFRAAKGAGTRAREDLEAN